MHGILRCFADRIDRVDIFGSRALGRAHAASDIDLVLHGQIDDALVARLWTMFADSTLAVTVDVVAYAPLDEGPMKRHVDQYAMPLFDNHELRSQLSVAQG